MKKHLFAFTGAGSTGKSTLLQQCMLEWPDFNYIPEVTRAVKREYNLNINEGGTEKTQLAILAAHLHNVLTYEAGDKTTVLDRCIIDGIVYTEWLYDKKMVPSWVKTYAEHLMSVLIEPVDIIFYTQPDFDIVPDGERSVDVDFRNSIIKGFDRKTMQAWRGGSRLVYLTGSVEERFDLIKWNLHRLQL